MSQTNKRVTMLTEGAAMVALSFILSFLAIVKFPWGGSITVLSMLPIPVYALRYGAKAGFGVAFVGSVLQFAQGAMGGLFGWGLTPGVLVAVILLDYIVPYTLLGVAGFFGNKRHLDIMLATVTALGCRFACHYISGVAIWKTVGELFGLNIGSPYLYSLVYNGAYMLPEIIFTTIGALYIFKVPNIRRLIIEVEE